MEVSVEVELFLYVHFEPTASEDDIGPHIALVTVPAASNVSGLSADSFIWMKQKIEGDPKARAVLAALYEVEGPIGDVLSRMLSAAFELGRSYKEGQK